MRDRMRAVSNLQHVQRGQEYPSNIHGHVSLTQNHSCIMAKVWLELAGKRQTDRQRESD